MDRAGALISALQDAGADPVLVPLIDFEMSDNALLSAALRRLAAGEYRWLVISSITTVRALKQWCESAGTTLVDVIPSSTAVATIGPTSVAVLAAEGIHALLAPVDVQSAAGLVALWPDFSPADGGSNKVLLPQSNIAEPTLVNGLAAKGWTPEVVTAYKTVNYPAHDGLRLTASLELRAGGQSQELQEILTPAQAAGEIRAGAIHAVVLASGSAARRTAETMAPLPENCLLIAIGEPTRAEAERLGMNVAATAEHPTPEGIVAALTQAHTIFHTLDSQEPS
ncbi:Uroporphyrinogen-III synthase [Arthrobacter sp. PAMC 25486]|nr:Uroporphyrinogen-III synthase [Arthrobacter sp. PAMC 25486]